MEKVLKWLKTWKQELVGIPAALTFFHLSKYGVRWLDPTAGVYDSGVLQSVFLALFKLTFFGLIVWVAIRHTFKELWTWFNASGEDTTQASFKNDFNSVNQWHRIQLAFGFFLALLFMLVLLDKAGAAAASTKYESVTNLRITNAAGTNYESNTNLRITKTNQRITNCVVQTALTQVGVKEATGHNDGKQVESYLASVHLKKGNPWCAAFVAWTLDRCNVKHPMSGYCPDWFRSTKYESVTNLRNTNCKQNKNNWRMQTRSLQGGVFGIWFASLGRIAHVGIIKQVNGNMALTIEGNTNDDGSRDGDGVYCKRRLLKQIYVVTKFI